MATVPLADIAVDAGTQIRAAINESVVAEYADRMTDGAEFPPVVVFHDGTRYYLADGFHRVLAATRNQYRDISADIRTGTKTDALWFALGANRTNGHRMTDADKKHAIELAYATWPDRGQREIADQIGCSQRYVSTVRNEIQVRTGSHLPDVVTGKDGKQYPASRGPNPKSIAKRAAVAAALKEGRTADDIAASVGVSMSTVTEVKRDIGAPVIDKSRAAIEKRRQRMRSMAADGFTSRQIAGAVGMTEEGCRKVLRDEGIEVPGDRVTRGTHRHDANRIIERMALDASNLCADVDLIDFSDIDKSNLAEWLKTFQNAREQLGGFIRRLMKEQQKHGEAA
jgi:hypothetical protein